MSDIEVWAKVQIQGYKKGMSVDRAILKKETEEDCLSLTGVIKKYKTIMDSQPNIS